MLTFQAQLIAWVLGALGFMAVVWWGVDAIGDRREAKVHAHYAAIELKKKEAVEVEAKAGEDARLPALRPGSVARLRADWCRDCSKEAR